jgi:phytoene/squalene synthetase
VTEQHIANRLTDDNMRDYIQFEIMRTYSLMLSGKILGDRLKGRAGLEIRTVVQGGLRILHKLEAQKEDVFSRPRLNAWDGIMVILRAVV